MEPGFFLMNSGFWNLNYCPLSNFVSPEWRRPKGEVPVPLHCSYFKREVQGGGGEWKDQAGK